MLTCREPGTQPCLQKSVLTEFSDIKARLEKRYTADALTSMPAKDRPRRDTYLTVGIGGYQQIAPNVHLATATIPGEHWKQIVGHDLSKMDHHLEAISLEHATHGEQYDGVHGFDFHAVTKDGSLVDISPDQRVYIHANNESGAHHMTHTTGAAPGQSGSMHALTFSPKPDDPAMKEKLSLVGLNTPQAIKDMHDGVTMLCGTDEKGNSMTSLTVPPNSSVHKLIRVAKENPFPSNPEYRSDTAIQMKKEHYDRAVTDLTKAIEATRIDEDPFAAAENLQVASIYHGPETPHGTTHAHLKITTVGKPERPSQIKIDGDPQKVAKVENAPTGMKVESVKNLDSSYTPK